MLGEQEITLFEAGRFVDAAEAMADSTEPIENVLLQFYSGGAEAKPGLKRYLQLKVNKMTGTKDLQQRDVLVLSLLELHLSELEEIQKFGNGQSTSFTDAYAKLREFISNPIVQDALRKNFSTVSNMTRQHDGNETLLHLADVLGEYSVVIDSYIRFEKYDEALNVLSKHGDAAMFDTYVPRLIAEIPTKTAAVLRERRRKLDVAHLMGYINQKPTDAIEAEKHANFIDWVFEIFNESFTSSPNTFPLLHNDKKMCNTAVKLYLDFRPHKLLEFLKLIGRGRYRLPYDFDAVLRTCLDKGLDECCVFLYCIDRRYRDAVTAALRVSIDLARQCAVEMVEFANDVTIDLYDLDVERMEGPERPSEEEQIHVWQLIAKHIIENRDIINSGTSPTSSQPPSATANCVVLCMALVEESKHILKVSDIIASYPSFSTIIPFKEMILSELKRRCKTIEENKAKIAETITATHDIRRKLRTKRMDRLVLKADDKCAVCEQKLLTERFDAFICRHFIHFRCLEALVLSRLSEADKKHYFDLTKREKILLQKWRQSRGNEATRLDANRELQSIKAELHDMLAKDCPLCNNIEAIDIPIISDEQHKINQDLYAI